MPPWYGPGPGSNPQHLVKSMVAQAQNLSTLEVEAEDQEFDVVLGYTVSLGAAWATQ